MGPVGRVSDRRTFVRLARARRAKAGPVTVRWAPDSDGAGPRVAYAAGRSLGSAVERNRIRRRLRALVAERSDRLPAGSYLVGVSRPAIALSHHALRECLVEALERVTDQETPR